MSNFLIRDPFADFDRFLRPHRPQPQKIAINTNSSSSPRQSEGRMRGGLL